MWLQEPIITVAAVAAVVAAVLAAFCAYHARWVWARIGTVAVALATVVMFVAGGLPAHASERVIPNPSAPGSSSVSLSQLPTCSGVAGAKADDMWGQGWIYGSKYLPVQVGTRTAFAGLMLPCWQAAGGLSVQVQVGMYVLTDGGTYAGQTPTIRVTLARYTCNGVDVSDTGVPRSWNGGIPNSSVNTWYPTGIATATSTCKTATDRLSKVYIAYQSYFNGSLITGTATWLASAWTDGTRFTKPANVGEIPLPDGGETPVVCPYLVDTTDILTTLGSFFTTFGPWVVCLFSPSGWDRAGGIPDSFELSGISRLGDVVVAGIPLAGSIYCGDLISLPYWGVANVPINTCVAASAIPSWVKIAAAGLSILAIGFLFFRRFQWTVQK